MPQKMPEMLQVADAERLVVLENRFTTGAGMAAALKDDIVQNSRFSHPKVLASRENPADTLNELGENLRDGDLLYLLTGDGVGNTVAQFAGDQDAPQFATMFGPLGNARNNYKATVGEKYRDLSPSRLLSLGDTDPIWPLRARVEGPQSYTRLGLSIISVGAIATGAAVLEEPKHRNNRLRKNEHTRYPYEIYLSLFKALPKTRTLEVADENGGNVRPLLDLFAAHAPEIGKAASFDHAMTDEEFLLGTIKDRAPWHLGLGMLRLMRGNFPVEHRKPGQEAASFRLTHSRHNKTAMIQFDGEPQALAMGSTVSLDQVGPEDATHRAVAAVTVREDRLA